MAHGSWLMAYGLWLMAYRWFKTAAVFAMISGVIPQRAAAEWVLTPFVGWTFGGSARINAGSARDNASATFTPKINYGASLAAMRTGVVGFEIDVGHSPNFFEDHTSGSGFRLTNDSRVTTLTGNVIVGAHGGPIRPYVVGGAGLIRTNLHNVQRQQDSANNHFGINVGGGVIGLLSQNLGLRGDIRYFRSFHDTTDFPTLEDFTFWRGSVGVSITF
jgi:opacity protein-like surface antigen